MKKNKILFIAAPLITLLILFAFSACSGGEFYDPGYLAAPDFANGSGGSGGDWEDDYSGGNSSGSNNNSEKKITVTNIPSGISRVDAEFYTSNGSYVTDSEMKSVSNGSSTMSINNGYYLTGSYYVRINGYNSSGSITHVRMTSSMISFSSSTTTVSWNDLVGS